MPARDTGAHMGLFHKQEKVEAMLRRYFAQCDACYDAFKNAFDIYFNDGLGDAYAAAVKSTHAQEAKADDIRRDIELTLYGKALLPESRGDVLDLLEAFDGLPNIAETVVFVLDSQRIVMPEPLRAKFRELVDLNLRSYDLCRKAVDQLVDNPKVILHTTQEIDHAESASDHVERDLIYEIFAMDLDNGMKLILKEAVILVGEISDRAQNVGDRLGIISIKRQI